MGSLRAWLWLASAGLVGAPCLLPVPARAAYIEFNGQCVASADPNCAPDTLPIRSSNFGLSFNRQISIGGDQFRTYGTIFATNTIANVVELLPIFWVRYNGPALAHPVTLAITISQNYVFRRSGGAFSEVLEGDKTSGFAPGSQIAAQMVVGGNGLPVLGPYDLTTSGTTFGSPIAVSEHLSSLSNPLTDTLVYQLVFGQGSVGNVIVEVPEAPALLFVSAGLLGLGVVRRR